MCDTCPAHIPGPGEVAGGLLSGLVGAALTKPGRRVMFWGLAIPMVLGIIVYTLGWWLVPITLGLLALAAVAVWALRGLQRHAVVVAPPSLRAALPAPRRAVALPRGLSVTRRRRALPAPAKALPAAAHDFVPLDWDKRCGHLAHPQANRCFLPAKAHPAAELTGRVVPAPVRGKMPR
jgi:hypothetical protein